MKTIHVRVDAETLAVLERLERALVGPPRGRRSTVVRQALHAAAGRK